MHRALASSVLMRATGMPALCGSEDACGRTLFTRMGLCQIATFQEFRRGACFDALHRR